MNHPGKDTFFSGKRTLNVRGTLVEITAPVVMGVINITPDSFYEGSRYPGVDEALRQCEKMLSEGAGMIDLGAYSSRPGAGDITMEEEWQRLKPVLQAIRSRFPEIIISVDTFRSQVARNAVLGEGADMINDVSGGQADEEMYGTMAELRVPYVMMHMKGTPAIMQQLAVYNDLMGEILDFFMKRTRQLIEMGVHDVIIDPGFGFAKTLDHNYELLHRLDRLRILGLPVMVGLSRKSMIYKLLGITPAESLNGTTVLNTVALLKGADILRVHDVKEAVETVRILQKLQAF